jgi:hypothetical protein
MADAERLTKRELHKAAPNALGQRLAGFAGKINATCCFIVQFAEHSRINQAFSV